MCAYERDRMKSSERPGGTGSPFVCACERDRMMNNERLGEMKALLCACERDCMTA